MIRILAAISFAVSGFFAATIEKYNQGLCVFEYIKPNVVTYLRDLHGVSSDDYVMVGLCGWVAVFFGIVLYFVKNKILFTTILLFAFGLELMLLNMIDTVPYKTVLYDSIFQCNNWSVLGWFLMQVITMVLTVIYLARNNYADW